MSQANLFEWSTDRPWTPRQASAEALGSVRESLPEVRARVFQAIRERPEGMTCDEVEVALEMPHQTASARITELRDLGRIVSIGRRKTRSGRGANVWGAAS